MGWVSERKKKENNFPQPRSGKQWKLKVEISCHTGRQHEIATSHTGQAYYNKCKLTSPTLLMHLCLLASMHCLQSAADRFVYCLMYCCFFLNQASLCPGCHSTPQHLLLFGSGLRFSWNEVRPGIGTVSLIRTMGTKPCRSPPWEWTTESATHFLPTFTSLQQWGLSSIWEQSHINKRWLNNTAYHTRAPTARNIIIVR